MPERIQRQMKHEKNTSPQISTDYPLDFPLLKDCKVKMLSSSTHISQLAHVKFIFSPSANIYDTIEIL
uniref:Uncharacterized protein n=1 Tax=Arundo donax TaxID=35708 RepID=A0A0A9GFT4_ARUDO